MPMPMVLRSRHAQRRAGGGVMEDKDWIEQERVRFEAATLSQSDENLTWSKKYLCYTEYGWRTENADVSTRMFRAWLAAKRDAVPEGWRVVPVEPTEEMLKDGYLMTEYPGNQAHVWAAMLNAAPRCPNSAPKGDDKNRQP